MSIALLPFLPAIFSAIGSAAQSGMSAAQQNKANAMNVAMQRETNALNYKIFQETQAYNSPENQVKMLRAAGINPVTAYGGLSSVSKMSPIALDSPKVQAVQTDMLGGFQNIAQTLSLFKSQELANEEIASRSIENQFKAEDIRSQIDKRLEETKSTRTQSVINLENLELMRQRLAIDKQTASEHTLLNISALKMQAAQTKNVVLKNKAQIWENEILKVHSEFARAESAAQLKNLQTRTELLLKDIGLRAAQTDDEIIKKQLDALSLSLGLESYNANLNYLKSKASTEHYKSVNEAQKPWWNLSKEGRGWSSEGRGWYRDITPW